MSRKWAEGTDIWLLVGGPTTKDECEGNRIPASVHRVTVISGPKDVKKGSTTRQQIVIKREAWTDPPEPTPEQIAEEKSINAWKAKIDGTPPQPVLPTKTTMYPEVIWHSGNSLNPLSPSFSLFLKCY